MDASTNTNQLMIRSPVAEKSSTSFPGGFYGA